MALSAFIFDLDGTLLDTNRLHARAFQRAFAEHDIHIGLDRLLLEIGKGGDRLVPSVAGASVEAEHGDALRDRHGDYYLELVHAEGARVFPGVRDVFGALRARGLQTAVATASKRDHLDVVTGQAGLDLGALADVVVTDSDVEESKPASDVVEAAVRKLGVSPAACAMVGDTPYDIQAASRCGVVAFGLLTGMHSEKDFRWAGARGVYADVAALGDDLDAALHEASPAEEVLTRERMEALMDAALEEARAGRAAGEVPIGSVLAKTDGTIVARGHNEVQRAGTRTAHAEMQAFRAAAGHPAAQADDLVLVTTLEPCVMCYGASMAAGVDTVVYALEAPSNGGVARCAPIHTPGAVPPRVVGGVRRAESLAMLREWLEEHPDATFVRDLMQRV